jgi:hypothetical protein
MINENVAEKRYGERDYKMFSRVIPLHLNGSFSNGAIK